MILYPQNLILNTSYLMMRSGRADLSVCDSLENGGIVIYNQIRTKANSEFDILPDETDIDSILRGKGGICGWRGSVAAKAD